MKNLFDGLNQLCNTNEAFYFTEQEYGENHIIRSYTYRLASWSDFKLPYALDCRGTAFIYDKRTENWDIFCRGYRKFFNLGEGIDKKDYIKENSPLYSFEKLDGSLIFVGKVEGELVAKSKTSINSDHAKKAQELIEKNITLTKFLHNKIDNGLTPVMELVGPGDFRIVLSYEKEELIWLGSVKNYEYDVEVVTENTEQFKKTAGIRCAGVNNFSWDDLNVIQETGKPNIEGFVVKTESGFVKVKLVSYCNLHHLKSSVNNANNLIQLILSDNLDDLIGQFQDDPLTLKYITETQEKVAHKFNHMVVAFKELRRKYFQDYREVRKDFAIAHSKDECFGSVMKTLNTSFRDVEKVAEEQVKMMIESRTKTLNKAKEWLDTI